MHAYLLSKNLTLLFVTSLSCTEVNNFSNYKKVLTIKEVAYAHHG